MRTLVVSFRVFILFLPAFNLCVRLHIWLFKGLGVWRSRGQTMAELGPTDGAPVLPGRVSDRGTVGEGYLASLALHTHSPQPQPHQGHALCVCSSLCSPC